VILIVSFAFAAFAVLGPYSSTYNDMSIEIIGTILGVLIALTLAEILKLDRKRERETSLITSLLSEVRTIIKNAKNLVFWLPSDMWDMGIASGDLSLVENNTRDDFRQYFYLVKVYCNLAATLPSIRLGQDQELYNTTRSNLEGMSDTICRIGGQILERYST
jgi:hypothetical protein